MAFTYDLTTIATNPIHEVRLLTGQTEEATSQIEDEEIQYFLTKNGNDVPSTVSDVLNTLLKEAAHAFDKQTGEVSESQSQRYQQLKELIGDPPSSDIETVFPTPVSIYTGGLYSEDFALRNADQTVYQGFQTEDANPWDIGTEDVHGVGVGEVQDSGQTEATDLNLDQV